MYKWITSSFKLFRKFLNKLLFSKNKVIIDEIISEKEAELKEKISEKEVLEKIAKFLSVSMNNEINKCDIYKYNITLENQYYHAEVSQGKIEMFSKT